MIGQIKKLILNVVMIASLGACAASDSETDDGPRVVTRLPTDAEVEQHNALVDPVDRIACADEVPVGSNIPRRNCWLVRDRQENSIFQREQLRNVLH